MAAAMVEYEFEFQFDESNPVKIVGIWNWTRWLDVKYSFIASGWLHQFQKYFNNCYDVDDVDDDCDRIDCANQSVVDHATDVLL